MSNSVTPDAPPSLDSNSTFSRLVFKHRWRPYQARVLDAIDHHLKDQRLHIVAAPGAGKTTLGLEVFRKLGKKALALSPTRTIRDQWLRRLSDFGEFDDPLSLPWVSRDLREPAVLTSITYQALHAQLAETSEPETEVEDPDNLPNPDGDANPMVEALDAHGIGVLILDEAHHLRAEWWKVLDQVMSRLPGLTLVSLTATPPYDASEHEWNKYEALCGPIDEEISVPELVKAGTLCPHQDFVWVVDATQSERNKMKEYDATVSGLCQSLFENPDFERIVLGHPWLVDCVYERSVLKNAELSMALLVFAKAKRSDLPQGLCAMMDVTPSDIPELGRRWWQVLVEQVLFSTTFDHSENHRGFVKSLKQQLRASGLLYRRDVRIVRSRQLGQTLSLSSAKIQACVAVHRLEHLDRGSSLRQVILTDYIRDEHRQSPVDSGMATLGAWPIFEALLCRSPAPEHLALLTGRLTVIPAPLLAPLSEQLDPNRITTRPLADDSRFIVLEGPLNRLARGITQLLLDGHIRTLVGTRSLLGEGWDAPVINSLVLATSVGSFMLTNQMRGRALRTDPQTPDKISSIWHLVAIDKQCPSGLWDFEDLARRFDTFVGLSERSSTIESGLARLAIDDSRDTSLESLRLAPEAVNYRMRRRFEQREQLAERWRSALAVSPDGRVHPTVSSPPIPSIRRYHIGHTFKYVLTQVLTALGSALSYVAQIRFQGDVRVLLWLLGSVLLGVLAYRWKATIRTLRIFFRHLPVDGALLQIGQALKSALCADGQITTPEHRLSVRLQPHVEGTFQIALEGGTFYEASLFADCFAELLTPIENPRYLLRREGYLYAMPRDDYHAVPLVLGARKSSAERFLQAWEKHVGPGELIYCRSDEGRSRLLKARMRAFSSTFQRELKRQDRWQ